MQLHSQPLSDFLSAPFQANISGLHVPRVAVNNRL
jgi:hypothetical protein